MRISRSELKVLRAVDESGCDALEIALCRTRFVLKVYVFEHAPLQEFGAILMKSIKKTSQRCRGR